MLTLLRTQADAVEQALQSFDAGEPEVDTGALTSMVCSLALPASVCFWHGQSRLSSQF